MPPSASGELWRSGGNRRQLTAASQPSRKLNAGGPGENPQIRGKNPPTDGIRPQPPRDTVAE
jgi:hypothetical protein